MTRKWKKVNAGCYTNGKWIIERSSLGGWNVLMVGGNVLDNLPTKKEAMRIYG